MRVVGRHDPVIVPRAVVVVEAMTALTIADLLLQNMCSRMENIKKVYGAHTGSDTEAASADELS